MQTLSSQLLRKRFFSGESVDGELSWRGGDFVETVEFVRMQLHGHVVFDPALFRRPEVPKVSELFSSSFTSDESGSSCFFSSASADLLVSDDSAQSFRFTGPKLPPQLPPSFRSKSASVFYIATIVVKLKNHHQQLFLHIPFEVVSHVSKYHFEKGPEKPLLPTTPQPLDDCTLPFAVRCGVEQPFYFKNSLMHGRYDTEEYQKPQTSVFQIGKEKHQLVSLTLFKQRYSLGDTILGCFKFPDNTDLKCHQISACLVFEQYLSSLALIPHQDCHYTQYFGVSHEYTKDIRQTSFQFSVPTNGKPTIQTDLVEFKWQLKFEFITKMQSRFQGQVTQARMQNFKWAIPITICSPKQNPAFFMNSPIELCTGPKQLVEF